MKVFIAGATGAIGVPLVRILKEHGHEVFGMTRSQEKSDSLKELGAVPIVADAFDFDSVNSALDRIKPDVVIEQLTSLPKEYTPENMQAADDLNTRVRLEGGLNLHRAAIESGAKLYILQSVAFFYAPGEGFAGEKEPFLKKATPFIDRAVDSFKRIEQRVLKSSAIGGIVLRYGFFYGPGTWYHDNESVFNMVSAGYMPVIGDGGGVWSFIHVDDAAQATVSAVEKGIEGIYNIVDDYPSPVSVWLPSLAAKLGAPEPPRINEELAGDPDFIYYGTKLRGATNEKAKVDLNFSPRPLEWLKAPE